MVPQDERGLVTEIRHEPRLLVVTQRGALEIVVAQAREHRDRMLGDGEQARPLRRDGDAVQRVRVQHALGVVARGVDGAVDDEARGVDGKGRVLELLALLVDLDQARGGDLVEEHAVRIDQELVRRARHPRRDVGEHEVLPAEACHEPVAGGEIHPHRPFFGRDLVFQRPDIQI